MNKVQELARKVHYFWTAPRPGTHIPVTHTTQSGWIPYVETIINLMEVFSMDLATVKADVDKLNAVSQQAATELGDLAQQVHDLKNAGPGNVTDADLQSLDDSVTAVASTLAGAVSNAQASAPDNPAPVTPSTPADPGQTPTPDPGAVPPDAGGGGGAPPIVAP